MFKEIKQQAKLLIANNKALFFISIFLYTLTGIANLINPIWTSKLQSFIVLNISTIVLFPLTLGFIKILSQITKEQPLNMKELFYIYCSPVLLLRAFGLVLIVDVLLSAVNFFTVNYFYAIPFGALLGIVFGFLFMIASLYLFMAEYLFVLKNELSFLLTLKQSFQLMKGNVMDFLALSLTLILWYIPNIILIVLIARIIPFSLQYFFYYFIYFLSSGCIYLYINFVYFLFALKVIKEKYDIPNTSDRPLPPHNQISK